MSDLSLIWHDQAIEELTERWPKRTKWAMKETMAMTGGHIRKKVRTFIERGGAAWPPLAPTTRHLKGRRARSPLQAMAQLVRFKAVGGKNPRVRIGFFTATKRGNAAWNRRERGRFKAFFGGTPAAMAKKHEYGKRYRITRSKRRQLLVSAIATGMKPLKKSTKFITVPKRPMIGPVFRREKNDIPKYVARRFWEKMTSGTGTFR